MTRSFKLQKQVLFTTATHQQHTNIWSRQIANMIVISVLNDNAAFKVSQKMQEKE